MTPDRAGMSLPEPGITGAQVTRRGTSAPDGAQVDDGDARWRATQTGYLW
jgi:hypothetical protein